MSTKVDVKSFSKDMMKVLNEYTETVDDEVEKVTTEVTANLVKELKATSPKRKNGRSAGYSKAWTKKKSKTRWGTETIVYNKQWQLTHLLENGHASRDGGFVSGIPHIKPAEEKAIKEFETKVQGVIVNK